MTRPAILFAVTALACSAAGCATTSTPAPSKATPAVATTGAGAVTAAIGLLYQGHVQEARKVVVKVLETYPDDREAKSLLQQIDTPPLTLLGEENFPYEVRRDDTLSSLAERFLGDATLFYALARYNDLTLPVSLQPGSMLRIPGHPKPVAKPVRAAPRAPGRIAPPLAAAQRAPTAPTADKARAVKLRGAALEQLNRGNINQAVGLLQQALQNDPANPVIARDLDRAQRISRTVHAKP